MPTLVLPPRYTPDSIAVRRAAINAGWEVERLQGWHAPDWLRRAEPVLYGEPLFAAAIADDLGLALLEPPFDWLIHLPDVYLRRDVRYTTLATARKHTTPAFIKPAAAEKPFAARVYSTGAELPALNVLPDTVPVLVAEPVAWEVEYRCFVLNNVITTSSPYWREGELAQADDESWPAPDAEYADALAFAEKMLRDPSVPMPPAVVLDVGYIVGRGWAVVELNAAWGSGLYGCDPDAVLLVLTRASQNRDTLSLADVAWVIEQEEV